MNVFGKREDRWRRGRKRGVSPIIATILLVAITVVLAAVLYVLVSGLTRTGASTPYTLGMAVSSASGSGSNYLVVLALSPSAGLATGILGLSVQNNVGTVQATVAAAPTATCKPGLTTPGSCTSNGAGWYGVLVASNGTVVATYSGSPAAWVYYTGVTTVTLSGSYTLNVISNVAYDGAGYTINAFGSGSSSVSGSQDL
jgi:flagellin-like protein